MSSAPPSMLWAPTCRASRLKRSFELALPFIDPASLQVAASQKLPMRGIIRRPRHEQFSACDVREYFPVGECF